MKYILGIFSFFIIMGIGSGAMSIPVALVIAALGIALTRYKYRDEKNDFVNAMSATHAKKSH